MGGISTIRTLPHLRHGNRSYAGLAKLESAVWVNRDDCDVGRRERRFGLRQPRMSAEKRSPVVPPNLATAQAVQD
jgi:hypothetical protein